MDEINNNDPMPMATIMSRLTAGQWAEPKPQPAPSLPAWLDPATPEQAALNLSRCLTLSAPTGMSLDDRTEWLMVASDMIGHIPASLLEEACKHAGKVCDHPAKIIPAICAYADKNRSNWEYCNRPQINAPRLSVVRDEPKPEPIKPMTQADVDATPDYLIGLGIASGAIVRDANGNLRPAPQTKAE
jgi:hypothetical protein